LLGLTTMNYELAKQLKDAGFPQEPELEFARDIPFGEQVTYPTLSELIEACGYKIHGIHQDEDIRGEIIWFATLKHDYRKFISNGPSREGKTPEEAVAKLWLALHPNPQDLA
jgi:hypothetical protein